MISLPDRIADIPARLVEDLALGLYEPEKVAQWHGLSTAQWDRLKTWPPLVRAVEAKQAEFDREGLSRRVKMAMQFDAVGDELFKQMMAAEATPRMRLEYLQMAAEVADLKPKKDTVQQGSGFSVVINLGGAAASTPSVTIEQFDPLDAPPQYLKLVPEAALPAYG